MIPLSRRALLRGAGAACLGLPLLEVMPRASSAPPVRRLVILFGGYSLGCDGEPDELVTPVGGVLDGKPATAPLAAVRDEIAIVSGLRIPVGPPDANDTPPGGISGIGDAFHQHAPAMLTGFRQERDGLDMTLRGPTADQLVADAWAGATPWRSLTLRAQPRAYTILMPPQLTLSYRDLGPGGVVPVSATTSPRRLYGDLTTAITPADPAVAAARAGGLAGRRSALDAVREHGARLAGTLGAADRQRLERHLDEVRALEQRLAAPSVAEHGACALPLAPVDPAVGQGWSDEPARAADLTALVRMAFACDQTRVVTLMLSSFRTDLDLAGFGARRVSQHASHHAGDVASLERAITWHHQAFADLVAALRDTPDGEGSLLDSTAVVMLNEGGHGRLHGDYDSHATENMVALVAGGAGGWRPGGRHIVAAERHPASVLISAMQAVGVETETLGDVEGGVDDLFG